ncbi:hypothetical protein GP924_25130 [Enterobacteriaceae bacterium 8376wB9]|nr:hypothetical protein [Enterobacteriaceae bacterium 8376wB9]
MCKNFISLKYLILILILIGYNESSYSELHNPINKKVLALSQSENIKATRFKSKNNYKFSNHSFQYKFDNTILNTNASNPYLRFNNLSLDGKYTNLEGNTRFTRNVTSFVIGSEFIVFNELTESRIEVGITSLKGENKRTSEDKNHVTGMDGFVLFYNMIDMYKYVNYKQSFQISTELSLGFNRSFECKNCKIKNESFMNSWRTQLEYKINDALCIYGKCYDSIITGAIIGPLMNDMDDSDFSLINEFSFVFEKDISNIFKGRRLSVGIGYLINNVGDGASIIISI